MSANTESKWKPSRVRKLVIGAVLTFIAVGVVAGLGTGTLSSLGYEAIAYICPLGSLEALLGSWAFVPRALIVLAATVIIVVFVGKAFCAWVCPVPPIADFFKTKKVKEAEKRERIQAGQAALENYNACSACGGASCVQAGKRGKVNLDSRHAVLAGALGSAAIFGFPVFCLVCPIGLTIATFIAFWRLVGFNEPTLDLIVFPAIVILEVVVLRKWCSKICPMGALLSLISTFNKTLRPKVDHDKCRRASSEACAVCAIACPEHIDPVFDLGKRPMVECTKCNLCVEACPAGAIRMVGKGDGDKAVELVGVTASEPDC